MATDTDKKLYVALAVLAVLGGTLFLLKKKEKEEAATYTLSGQAASLPKIAITEDDTKAIDKIVITKPGDEDGGAGSEVELAKQGEDWRVVRPVEALANQANVKSLLDNLKGLKVTELIDAGKASYDKFKVADGKGLHAVFKKGDTVVLDAIFGELGGRGQMTRIAGKEGVYAIKGYSSYLYDRELKGWRDTTVFKFEENVATNVSIENEHGNFVFTKDGETWSAKHKGAPLAGFDEAKIKDLIRAYKGLNADGFAEKEKSEADLGLDKPAATIVITLNDGAKRELRLGATAEGSSRWAKASGLDEVVSISSWAADWALAEPKKFKKPDDKKDDKSAGGAKPAAAPATPPPAAHGPDDGHGH